MNKSFSEAPVSAKKVIVLTKLVNFSFFFPQNAQNECAKESYFFSNVFILNNGQVPLIYLIFHIWEALQKSKADNFEKLDKVDFLIFG